MYTAQLDAAEWRTEPRGSVVPLTSFQYREVLQRHWTKGEGSYFHR
jgi:hypothetical protein